MYKDIIYEKSLDIEETGEVINKLRNIKGMTLEFDKILIFKSSEVSRWKQQLDNTIKDYISTIWGIKSSEIDNEGFTDLPFLSGYTSLSLKFDKNRSGGEIVHLGFDEAVGNIKSINNKMGMQCPILNLKKVIHRYENGYRLHIYDIARDIHVKGYGQEKLAKKYQSKLLKLLE